MKYGLIGEKLAHSFSEIIHEKIAGYSYELREISKDDFDSFMKEKDFCAINVTIPYKSAVIPYLDYIDPVAEKIGAVNTVVNRQGKLFGYNTDFGGMRMLIEKQGFDYKGKKVLICGTGGTSKTAVAVAESFGCSEVVLVSRSGEVNYENVYSLHPDVSFVINTTPCGMFPDNFSAPLKLEKFVKICGVTDVVYNPLKTQLCLESEKIGVPSESGLYMLVGQAVLACEKFTGEKLEVNKTAYSIYNELLKEKKNVVLVGMPGSGKSTIGKALSRSTGKEFVDTDEIIVRNHGIIKDIFKSKGEPYFRDLETEAVKEVSKRSGIIIATGGGAVLRKENVEALRQNGEIFFLNRPLSDIMPTDDRPLSKDFEGLKKRFEERYDIYVASSDYEIAVDGVVENAVSRILEIIK